jgi:hypothetical protein
VVVRRAQLGTNPGHPLKENENEQARREESDSLVVLLLAERARSECARPTRAVWIDETNPKKVECPPVLLSSVSHRP